MRKDKTNLILLLFIVLVLIVVLLQNKCTDDTTRLDTKTEVDVVNDIVCEPIQPVDTLLVEPTVEVEEEDGKDKKPKRKTVVPVDAKPQVIPDDIKEDEVTSTPEVTPVIEVKKTEEKTDLPTDVDEGNVYEESVPKEMKAWPRHYYLKTNAIGWGMGIANLAVEMDLTKHWSITLPVYYAAWNYFDTTVKFRMFAVQPEVRYWFSEENQGLFTGAHVGLAYYNVAWGGDYRYQDHNRHTPAIGGGLSVGYRKALGKSQRWKLEFSLGVGVYSLHYDKFQNTPDYKDGLMVDSKKKTYWGVDQASVSFAYTLNFKRKGGKR